MKSNRYFVCLTTCIWIFLIPSLNALAQERSRTLTQDRAAQYYLGSADELLVPVNIWGFVQRPGQYMVPNNTDLVSLLSFAGGPTEAAKISNIQIVRSNSQSDNTVIKVNVKKYLETADEKLIPILRPGDTIIVKGTTFHWVSKFFEFVSRLTVVAQIVYFIALSHEYLSR